MVGWHLGLVEPDGGKGIVCVRLLNQSGCCQRRRSSGGIYGWPVFQSTPEAAYVHSQSLPTIDHEVASSSPRPRQHGSGSLQRTRRPLLAPLLQHHLHGHPQQRLRRLRPLPQPIRLRHQAARPRCAVPPGADAGQGWPPADVPLALLGAGRGPAGGLPDESWGLVG